MADCAHGRPLLRGQCLLGRYSPARSRRKPSRAGAPLRKSPPCMRSSRAHSNGAIARLTWTNRDSRYPAVRALSLFTVPSLRLPYPASTAAARTLEHHQGGSMSTANNYAAALQGRAPGRRPTAASAGGGGSGRVFSVAPGSDSGRGARSGNITSSLPLTQSLRLLFGRLKEQPIKTVGLIALIPRRGHGITTIKRGKRYPAHPVVPCLWPERHNAARIRLGIL